MKGCSGYERRLVIFKERGCEEHMVIVLADDYSNDDATSFLDKFSPSLATRHNGGERVSYNSSSFIMVRIIQNYHKYRSDWHDGVLHLGRGHCLLFPPLLYSALCLSRGLFEALVRSNFLA